MAQVPEPLSLSDLDGIGEEPRIKDIRLGECLGMAQPWDIRRTIEANRPELERYGPLRAAPDMVTIGSGAQREVTAYYLNEPQALLLCMFSRTERAADVRQEVIELYMTVRHGGFPAEITTIESRPAPARLRDRFAEECLRLGFGTPKEFVKSIGWTRKLFQIMEMDHLPVKGDDLLMLVNSGFDVPYIKTGQRASDLRATMLAEAWKRMPEERRMMLIED